MPREPFVTLREIYREPVEIFTPNQLADKAYICGAFADYVDRIIETERIPLRVCHNARLPDLEAFFQSCSEVLAVEAVDFASPIVLRGA